MTKEEVIAMAREAGYYCYDLTATHGGTTVETDEVDEWAQLERFARLVRNDYSYKHAALWLKRIDEAVEAERERIFDELKDMHEKTQGSHGYYLHAVMHIRARSNT